MTPDAADRAARALIDARLHRQWLTTLPAGCIPETSEDAYSIQERVAARFGPVGGFKAGGTPPGVPTRGSPVFASLIHKSPAHVPAESLRILGVEAELGFSFRRDLPPRSEGYSEDEVLDAIGAVHAAIEIVESRFADWERASAPSKLADNGSNGGVVVGPGYEDWRNVDPARTPVCLFVDGKETVRAIGGDKRGHPLSNMTWLANTYAPRFGGIRRGQIIITGSCTGITRARPRATVVADFGSIGQATVVFEAGSNRI